MCKLNISKDFVEEREFEKSDIMALFIQHWGENKFTVEVLHHQCASHCPMRKLSRCSENYKRNIIIKTFSQKYMKANKNTFIVISLQSHLTRVFEISCKSKRFRSVIVKYSSNACIFSFVNWITTNSQKRQYDCHHLLNL